MKNFDLNAMGVQEMDALEVKIVDGGLTWAEVLDWANVCLSASCCNWSFVNVGGDFQDVSGSWMGGCY